MNTRFWQKIDNLGKQEPRTCVSSLDTVTAAESDAAVCRPKRQEACRGICCHNHIVSVCPPLLTVRIITQTHKFCTAGLKIITLVMSNI